MKTRLRERWLVVYLGMLLLSCPFTVKGQQVFYDVYDYRDKDKIEPRVEVEALLDAQLLQVTVSTKVLKGFNIKECYADNFNFSFGSQTGSDDTHLIYTLNMTYGNYNTFLAGKKLYVTLDLAPVDEPIALVNIFNYDAPGSALLQNGEVVVSKDVNGNSSGFVRNALVFKAGVSPIVVRLEEADIQISNYQITVDGGDLTFSGKSGHGCVSDVSLKSGALSLLGYTSRIVNATGGKLRVEGLRKAGIGSYMFDLNIDGDVEVEGDFITPTDYWATLSNAIKISRGTVTLKNLILPPALESLIIDGGDISLDHVGYIPSYRNTPTDPGSKTFIIQNGGTLNIKDSYMCPVASSDGWSILKVKGGKLNIMGGYYNIDNDNNSTIISLEGSGAEVHIQDGYFGGNMIGGMIRIESGMMNIDGGVLCLPIYMNGGSLNVSGGLLMGGVRGNTRLGDIIVANSASKISLRGGSYSGNIGGKSVYFINDIKMNSSDILNNGYSFFTRDETVRPDIRLDQEAWYKSGNHFCFGSVKPTDTTLSNNCYTAACEANIGSSGSDIRVDGNKYYIKTAKGLCWLTFASNNRYRRLTNGSEYMDMHDVSVLIDADIDLSGYEWVPLNFGGKLLDGQGHRIYNLTVEGNSPSFIGFLSTGSTVANLIVEGKINRIDNEYTNDGTASLAGLIRQNNGTVVNCGFRGDISCVNSLFSSAQIGGLVCDNMDGIVENSYMVGSISVVREKYRYIWDENERYTLAGIVCNNYSSGQVSNSYFGGNEPDFTDNSGKSESYITCLKTLVNGGGVSQGCLSNPSEVNQLNDEVSKQNSGSSNNILWAEWEKRSDVNKGFPIHKFKDRPSIVTPMVTLVKKGEEGEFSAKYTSIKEDGTSEEITIKAGDVPRAVSGKVKLLFTSIPSIKDDNRKIKLEKITKRIMELPEEDIEEDKITIDSVSGTATMEYEMDGIFSVVFTAYFTYEKIVVDDKTDSPIIGDESKATSTDDLDIDMKPSSDNTPSQITIKKVTVSGTTTISKETNATFLFVGENDLGTIENKGVLTIAVQVDNMATIKAIVNNAGIFTDNSGLITEVTGKAALSVTPKNQSTVESGGKLSMEVDIKGALESELSYVWQRLEGGVWLPEKVETKSAPMLKADDSWVNTGKEITVNTGGLYRCWITREVDGVRTTLVTSTQVELRSDPDPVPDPTPEITYYSVVLPSVEGAITTPSAGSYVVAEGVGFTFSLILDKEYDQSKPMVKAGDKVIDPIADGKYKIKSVYADQQITISGITKNAPVGNAKVENVPVRVWGINGVLHIYSAQPTTAYIVSFGGKYKMVSVVGEKVISDMPEGAYVVRVKDQVFKIVF